MSSTPEQFIARCRTKGLEMYAETLHGNIRFAGPAELAEAAGEVLNESPELHAGLMILASKEFPFLADLLTERSAILEADGLPCTPLHAALKQITTRGEIR